ncbi:MAG TPA: glycoside hydrolase family 9 protein [Polyangiaceae bacterium]|nr:glycoside hydrolase family 9 protein [Polyangiaceae bacterium]
MLPSLRAGLRWMAAAGCAGSLGCSFLHTSDVRLNQVGYLPQASKIAIVESSDTAPLAWQVLDASGGVVAKGMTQPRGPDADSGDVVQWADFSSLRQPGKGYRLLVDGDESYRFSIDARVYQPLKTAAFNYFYQTRSGTPIEIPWAGEWQWTHGPGHLSDADVGCVSDCGYRLNALGGWYDAGDHGKYVVNGGISVWTLLDLYERTRYLHGDLDALGDGSLQLPENGNGVPDVLDEARWELEFLLAMQVPPGHEKSGMVHHKLHDSSWTTLGRVPAETWKERYLHAPSTAATLNLAATAAQCFRLWRALDAEFAERCRLGAIRAWNAAQKFPAVYAPSYDSQGGGPYDDSDVSDEFYWAACELYLAFGTPDLLEFIEQSPHHRHFPTETGHEHVKHHTSMTWQATAALGAISLAVVPSSLPEAERAELRSQIVRAADEYLKLIEAQGYRVPIARGSNGHYPWGSNSLVANNALVLALAHDFTHQQKYLDGTLEGLAYLLGRNPLNFSYVSGFGEHALENPHHRFWAHQKRSSFPHPPPGVLAGGPNSRLQDPTSNRLKGCPPQRCYIDNVDAWSVNEVAINWNAPLAWIATFADEKGVAAEKSAAPGAPLALAIRHQRQR